MIAQKVAPGAVLAGTHVLFTTAAQLLLDLGGQEPTRGLARRLSHYLLAADDVPVLQVAGMSFPPNLIVAGVLFLLTIIAYWLAREASGDA